MDKTQPQKKQYTLPTPKREPTLTAEQIETHQQQLAEWQVVANKSLRRRFKFANFQQALDFVVQVSALAEAADHHPQITFGWGFAEFELWTHTVGGLSEKDVSLAVQINRLTAPTQ